MASHSLAPWTIQGAFIIAANGQPVCEVLYTVPGNGAVFDADRNLIVTAPALLDYVRRCASNDAEANELLKQAEGR